MSGILRPVIFKNFINKITPLNSAVKSVSDFHVSLCRAYSVRFDQKTLEAQIKRLDMDVRRNGRVTRREMDHIIEKIKTSRSATPTQSLLVIRCCGSLISEELPEIRTNLVQEVWDVFQKLGIPLDVSHYNALLRVYLENEHIFSPSEFLENLEKRGIEPNRVTYQRLITKYCQQGDVDGATRILEVMKEKEIPINESIFNSLIMGHSRADDIKSAEGILDVMKQAGLEPSAETYTILINGYIKLGELDKVDALIEKCEASEMYFIDKDYLEIICALAKYGHDAHVDKIIGKIRKTSGYNQDAITYVHKLISSGKVDIAYKVLKTMSRPIRVDGSTGPSGNFFIAHLIRLKRPVDEIIKYCNTLVEEQIHPRPEMIAVENALRTGYEEAILPLLYAAKEKDFPVRQHFFWPLIVLKGKKNDINGLMRVLLTMNSDFNISVNTETIRDYVAPFVLKKDGSFDDAVAQLKLSGVSLGVITGGLVSALLERKQIKKAAELSSLYKALYLPVTIRRPLTQALVETKDIENFLIVLKNITRGIQTTANWKNQDKEQAPDEPIPEVFEFINQVLCDVIKLLRKYEKRSEFVEQLLQGYVNAGLALKPSSSNYIHNLLQSDLTVEISSLIEQLTASELHISPTQQKSRNLTIGEIDEEALENIYKSSKETGEKKRNIQKQLFLAYSKNRKLDKLLNLKKEMDEDGFVLTEAMHAVLIDSFIREEKLDEALKLFQETREKYPDFTLNKTKMLRLALLLIQNDQADKALEYLKLKDTSNVEENAFGNGIVAWRILNHFAEKGDYDSLKTFFDLFVEKNYADVTNVLLGPLIKVHLVKNDVTSALEEFEKCALKYRCTPWKSDLANKLIETENANALQKLTDVSSQIHGEINSLYDLMFSFLECGRIRQAKKILETPGLRLRQDRVYNASFKYQNQGSAEHLENLLNITRDVNLLDRGDICYNLLAIYSKTNEVDKALGLWVRMQEEVIQPDDHFLFLLGDLLQKNGKQVPFTVPTNITQRDLGRAGPPKHNPTTQELRKLISANEVDKALNYKNRVPIEQLNAADLSLLTELLLKNNRYEDAKVVLSDLLSTNALPIFRILKYFCKIASNNGDYEFLEGLKKRLPTLLQQICRISNHICSAYETSGKVTEFLNKFESEVDNLNDPEEVELYLKSYPKNSVLRVLFDHPELVPEVERFGEKCLIRNRNAIAPINVIWEYNMIQENYSKADEIWKNYLQTTDKLVVFGYILKKAFETNNKSLLDKLLQTVKVKPDLSPKGLGLIYSTYIDLHLKENNVQDALRSLEEALSILSIEDLNQKSLKTLKAVAQMNDIPFNYELKTLNKKYSSSDED